MPGGADLQLPRRYRSLDTTWRNMVVELLRAAAGLLSAFSASFALSAWAGWHQDAAGFAASASVFVFFGIASLFVTSGRPIQLALAQQRLAISGQEQALTAAAQGHQFTADLHDALEMAGSEAETVEVVGRAIDMVYDGPGELLLADSSRAHLHRAASTSRGAPGCGVSTPWACPAVRRGQTLEFPASGALAACPRLRERGDHLSALCVPVTILGTPMGVMHLAGEARQQFPKADRSRIESIAMQTGARIGMIRAMASSELAAATDPLTGLLNRRSMEDRLHELVRSGAQYAIAFGDLDQFKELNDTYGHSTGDRVLRHFARIATATVRDLDLVCRYGGEEFVIVFAHCDASEAALIVGRLRDALEASIGSSGLPRFSASFGVADWTSSGDSSAVIALADDALREAKIRGRDRVVLAAQITAAPVPEPA